MSTSNFMSILFFIALLGSICSVFFLIYKFIKKQPKKKSLVILFSCIASTILFSILSITTMTQDEKTIMAEKQAQQEAAKLTKQETVNISTDNKQQSAVPTNEPPSESPNPTKIICNTAGIGDKLEEFEKAYGTMTDMSGNKTFKSNTITVVPVYDTAYNVSVKITSSSILPIDVVKGFLPSDMKIIKQYSEDQFNDGNIRYITIGESELLKSSFPKEAGKFVVIQRIYAKEGYNRFVIGSGENP